MSESNILSLILVMIFLLKHPFELWFIGSFQNKMRTNL